MDSWQDLTHCNLDRGGLVRLVTIVFCFFFYNNTLNSEVPLSTHERKLNRTPRSTFPQSPVIKSSSGVKIQSSKKKTVGEIAKKDARKLVAVLIRCFFFQDFSCLPFEYTVGTATEGCWTIS